jgi:hypothetical protein
MLIIGSDESPSHLDSSERVACTSRRAVADFFALSTEGQDDGMIERRALDAASQLTVCLSEDDGRLMESKCSVVDCVRMGVLMFNAVACRGESTAVEMLTASASLICASRYTSGG